MKLNFLITLTAAAAFLLTGCAYDNFEAPESSLSGRVVYQGNALGVRNNGPQLELWEDGHALRTKIPVYLNQDGTFSASLFDGQYKLVRMGDSPWLQQSTDTLIVNVNGNTVVDVPMTPYFTVANASFQKSDQTITAQFTVNRIVETANIDVVRLFIGKTMLLDHVQQVSGTNASTASIVFGQPASVSAAIPDQLKDMDYVFARIGVKSTASSEYIYSGVQKVALK